MSSSGPDAKDGLVIGNTVAEMAKVVEFVEKFGAAHGIPQAAINDLNVCLDELLNNTISYGYDDQAPHSIAVDLTLAADLLIVDIEDDGKPFDPRQGTPKPSRRHDPIARDRGARAAFRQDIDGRGGLYANGREQRRAACEKASGGGGSWKWLRTGPAK